MEIKHVNYGEYIFVINNVIADDVQYLHRTSRTSQTVRASVHKEVRSHHFTGRMQCLPQFMSPLTYRYKQTQSQTAA